MRWKKSRSDLRYEEKNTQLIQQARNGLCRRAIATTPLVGWSLVHGIYLTQPRVPRKQVRLIYKPSWHARILCLIYPLSHGYNLPARQSYVGTFSRSGKHLGSTSTGPGSLRVPSALSFCELRQCPRLRRSFLPRPEG